MWHVPKWDLGNMDFLPTRVLDNTDAGLLDLWKNRFVVFREKPRHGNVFVARICQLVCEASCRMLRKLLAPFNAFFVVAETRLHGLSRVQMM